MKSARLLIGAVGVIALMLSARTAAAQQIDPRLPEGPNRELVAHTCSGCHALSNLYSTVGRTREGWTRVLEDMTRFGLTVTPQERALILDYLSISLAP